MCVSCWQPEVSRQQKHSVRFSEVVAAVRRRTAIVLACQNRRRNHDLHLCRSCAAVMAMLVMSM